MNGPRACDFALDPLSLGLTEAAPRSLHPAKITPPVFTWTTTYCYWSCVPRVIKLNTLPGCNYGVGTRTCNTHVVAILQSRGTIACGFEGIKVEFCSWDRDRRGMHVHTTGPKSEPVSRRERTC